MLLLFLSVEVDEDGEDDGVTTENLKKVGSTSSCWVRGCCVDCAKGDAKGGKSTSRSKTGSGLSGLYLFGGLRRLGVRPIFE